MNEHSGHKDKKHRIQVSSKKRNISYTTETNTKTRKNTCNDHERRPQIHPDACLHIDFSPMILPQMYFTEQISNIEAEGPKTWASVWS